MNKREILETILSFTIKTPRWPDTCPKSIFILRNNDLGDYLIITPLIRALKEKLPNTKIVLGVGSWSIPLVEHNPYIDEVVPTDAPWHNKQVCPYPANSIKGLFNSINFSLFSKTTQTLRKLNIDLGIDILGSQEGSLFLASSGIKNRIGVKGYAGGYKSCQKWVQYDESSHVGEAALRVLPLLNIQAGKFSSTPEIYLTKEEKHWGGGQWKNVGKKIVITPGGGFREKCWPIDNYNKIIQLLLSNKSCEIIILGSADDKTLLTYIENSTQIINLCGETNLRETCSIINSADLLIGNSSFSMHVAGAFGIPNTVLLGEWYDSAKLHQKQWGHALTRVLGKEKEEGCMDMASPHDAYSIIKDILEIS